MYYLLDKYGAILKLAATRSPCQGCSGTHAHQICGTGASATAKPAFAATGNGKLEPAKSDTVHRAQFHEVIAARTAKSLCDPCCAVW